MATAMDCITTTEFTDKIKQFEYGIVIKIIKEAMLEWNCYTVTDLDMLSNIEKIASKYDMTLADMKKTSMECAKTYSNYKFIPIDINDQIFDIRHTLIDLHKYRTASFSIDIDEYDNIIVKFRNKFNKLNPTGNLFLQPSLDLLSCLGIVYMFINIEIKDEIPILPDNIIHIGSSGNWNNDIVIKGLPRYLQGLDIKHLVFSKHNFVDKQLKYLSIKSMSVIEMINPLIETLKFSTNYIEFLIPPNFIFLPYGIKHLIIEYGIFENNFADLPPTLETIFINYLYTQLNGFPNSLKKLTVNNFVHPFVSNSVHESIQLKIKPECILISESPNGKAYDFTIDKIEFNDGFEELTIHKSLVVDILPKITHIPESFKKIIIDYGYVTSRNLISNKTNISDIEEYIGIDIYNQIEEENEYKSISKFCKLFPHVEISKINK